MSGKKNGTPDVGNKVTVTLSRAVAEDLFYALATALGIPGRKKGKGQGKGKGSKGK